MLGTWRWNAGFGITGVALTVIFSLGNNPMSVILTRSVYAFVAFFIVAYAARLALGIILKPPGIAPPFPDGEAIETRGAEMDLQTPDESAELNRLLKEQLQQGSAFVPQSASGQIVADQGGGSNGFKPLSPPQLISTAGKQPNELAKAVRHLTGE
jgi:hypothetical protein